MAPKALAVVYLHTSRREQANEVNREQLAALGVAPGCDPTPRGGFTRDCEDAPSSKVCAVHTPGRTASNGAVLYTGSGAASRGMNVIVPVDGMSAVDPYAEYSTVFTFMNAPLVSAKSTLTRSTMIKFQ